MASSPRKMSLALIVLPFDKSRTILCSRECNQELVDDVRTGSDAG